MNPKRKRIVALLLLAVMLVTFVSSVAAASDESAASTPEQEAEVTDSTLEDPVESTEPEEPSAEPSETPSPEPSEEAEPSKAPEVDQPEESPPIEETSGDDDVPRSDDGETLTRAEELFGAEAPAITVRGPLQAKANAGDPTNGSMTKSTCVDFAEYESPTWYCNRYYTEGTHVYGHYFYASTIAYHTIDGVWAYCIEPNTSSLANQPYQSYRADSASSTSYWMRELDSTQRKNIQMILAFGYPECDYGYGQQAQYAATQTLIWEVCCKLRYSDIKSSDSYGLYYKVNAVLGGNYANAYDAIVNAISFSDGTVPSFASSSESSAPTVKLSLNTSTNCYEASVSDSKSVLSHFTFTQSGVTFTKSGSTLTISVPASLASSVKGKVITGTSDQKVLSSSNPLVWENAYYQTVTTAGGADDVMAYFKLDWEDNGGIKLVKKTTDSSIDVSGWTFYFKPTTGDTITKTTGSDGTISLSGLTTGMKYTVTEKAYDGYVQPAAQTVTIEAGKTNTITFTNSPLKGNLTVNKAVNYGTMAGFKFHLKGTSTIGKKVDLTATTDSKGVAKFTDVYVGTYTLSEEDPGAAYIKMADQTVTITANETTGAAYTTTVRADNVWKYWSATITKVDSETGKSGNEMDGAEYTLYQNGKAVKVYTIKNGKFTTDEYPCTESDSVYTLKETKAPEGYTLNSTTYKLTTSYTHYTNKVNTFNVTVEDTAIKGKLQIEKWAVNTVSKDKQPEKGATFEVYLKSAGSYAKADEKHRDIITIGEDGKGILLYRSTQGRTRDGEEHGSATWGSPSAVNRQFAQRKSKILTRHVRLGLDSKKHRRSLNVLVIGGSGAQKTRSYVLPNILEANTNYVITDPKMEVLLATGGWLKSQGYEIRVLNLVNLEDSDGYNPFRYLRDEKDVLKLVNNLIQATTPKGAHESDPFWTKSETALLQAIILMLFQEAPEYEQNFSMVMKVLEYAEVKEDDEDHVSPLDMLFAKLERDKPNSVAVRQYKVFKLAAGKTAKSILVSTAVRLAAFNLPQIKAITDHDDMDLYTLGEQKVALYAIVPLTVTNTRGYDLPKTGGNGTKLFYIFGGVAMVAALGAVALAFRKRSHA